MYKNLDKFDTSNFKENNFHQMHLTESVVGIFKDEYNGVPIECINGTGAKAYCIKTI